MECEEKIRSDSGERYSGEAQDTSPGPWCCRVAAGRQVSVLIDHICSGRTGSRESLRPFSTKY
jgi:hypothetical protein